jgi:hypothetical protein
MQEMEQRGIKVFRNNGTLPQLKFGVMWVFFNSDTNIGTDMMGNLIKMQTAERAYVLGLLAERLWRERGIDVTFDDFRVSVSRGLSAAVNVSGSVEWPTTTP